MKAAGLLDARTRRKHRADVTRRYASADDTRIGGAESLK